MEIAIILLKACVLAMFVMTFAMTAFAVYNRSYSKKRWQRVMRVKLDRHCQDEQKESKEEGKDASV